MGFEPRIITPERQYTAKRRPFEHSCKCGHREMIVPPCGMGEIIWNCSCGVRYRLCFAGKGSQCTESIFVGA